eukprot:1154186-Pyramimonas_sp.AAC.1
MRTTTQTRTNSSLCRHAGTHAYSAVILARPRAEILIASQLPRRGSDRLVISPRALCALTSGLLAGRPPSFAVGGHVDMP